MATQVNIKYLGKDQNWQDEQTIYWFTLDGCDYGTGFEFYNHVFGVIENPEGFYCIVDCDGYPIDGNAENKALERLLENAVTDEMRAE